MATEDTFKIPPIVPRRVGVEPTQLRPAQSATRTPATSFKDILSQTIGEVQRLQTEADMTIKKLVAGEIKDVTDAMLAVEKADVAFQTMMAVRNRIVAAYEEITRMQV